MKAVFEHIYDNNILRVAESRICFMLQHYELVFEFDEIPDEILDNLSYESNINHTVFSTLSSNSLIKIFLRNYQFIYKNENNVNEYPDNYSIGLEFYRVIHSLNSTYPNAIRSFKLEHLYVEDICEGWGCPDDAIRYGYEIEINSDYWANLDFYDFINSIDISKDNPSIPSFYNKEQGLADSFELKILSSNTKVRRLGYLKILLNMFLKYKAIPAVKINTKFENYCQNFEDYRFKYKNTKGNVIITKTGNSAKPYIDLAITLGLLQNTGGIYQIGKQGKVYNILKPKVDVFCNENPFVLSDFDVSFFSELLLKEDFWFLRIILEQTMIVPDISYQKLKKCFRDIALKQIDEFINDASLFNTKKILSLKLTERRIGEWKKSEVYLEHILMPRLNWLYDMNLIELKDDLSFVLTPKGVRFTNQIIMINDISLHKIVSPSSFLEKYYMKFLNEIFVFKRYDYTDLNNEKFHKCICEGFILFKTLAPNRITFSLFASYAKHMFFWLYNTIIDTEDIKKLFYTGSFPNYILKYQDQYKDGYIQKLN